MAPKRAAKRKVKKQRGKGVAELAGKIAKVARDTKIISTALNTLAPDSSIAQTVSGMADQLGYGRKRKPRKQKGTGFSDIIGSILGGVGGGIGKGVNATLGGLFGGSRVQSYAVNPMMIR